MPENTASERPLSRPLHQRLVQLRPQLLAGGGTAALVGGIAVAIAVGWPGGAVFTTAWTTAVFGLLALGAALLSGAAGATSAATARRAYGQQLYELARAAHTDMTTGEVAAARDHLGTLARDRQQVLWRDGGPPPSVLRVNIVHVFGGAEHSGERMTAARRDWFALLWCFQRIHAVHRLLVHAPPEATYGNQSPQEFLEDLVRTQVRFLDSNEAVHARAALEEFFDEPVDDADSAGAFRELVRLLLPDTSPQRWARPLTTQSGQVLDSILRGLPQPAEFPLEGLADEQFSALHQYLYTGESGEHMAERVDLGRRMRARADALSSDRDGDKRGLLRERAEALVSRLPATVEVLEP